MAKDCVQLVNLLVARPLDNEPAAAHDLFHSTETISRKFFEWLINFLFYIHLIFNLGLLPTKDWRYSAVRDLHVPCLH